MNSKDTKSSAELKKDVLRELNQVNSDLDRIQGRLTPGQFIDDAVFHPAGRNPRAVFDHLKANPVGTAFLSIGTLLLMEDETHITYEQQMRKRSSDVIENSRYQATLLKGRVSDIQGGINGKVSGVSDKLHGAVDRAKSKVTNLKDRLSGNKEEEKSEIQSQPEFLAGVAIIETQNSSDGINASGSGIDQIKDNLDGVKDTVTQKFDSLTGNMDEMKDSVGNKIDSLSNGVKETASEQLSTVRNLDPMTLAAIGAGLGALTGIALPVSEKEQTLIDQKASGKLNEIGSEFQDSLNESVKVLKDEFLGKFGNFDVNLFGKKNDSFGSESQI